MDSAQPACCVSENETTSDNHVLFDQSGPEWPTVTKTNDTIKLIQQLVDEECAADAGCETEELCLSVVVPVYNERRWLHAILERIRAVPIAKEIILIDDCSTDGTRDILKDIEREAASAQAAIDAGKQTPQTGLPLNRIRVAFHEKNQGKGASLRTGFALATGQIVIIQDADLEYSPSDYPQLIQPIVDGRADVVFGSRYLGQARPVLNFWHCQVNRLLTTISNIFTGLNLTDMETCYKVFRTPVLQEIAKDLKSDRFGFEPEISARLARRKLRIFEVPISYSPRTYEEGKKITWRDGIDAIARIVWFRFAK